MMKRIGSHGRVERSFGKLTLLQEVDRYDPFGSQLTLRTGLITVSFAVWELNERLNCKSMEIK